MAIVSHLPPLFNPETCQAYIHRLRWKDRPLQGYVRDGCCWRIQKAADRTSDYLCVRHRK